MNTPSRASVPEAQRPRGVTPITRAGADCDAGLLLVYVVDENGVPLEGADIRRVYADGKKGNTTTTKRWHGPDENDARRLPDFRGSRSLTA